MATQREIAAGYGCIHGKWERVESAGGTYLGDVCKFCGASFGFGICDNCGKQARLLTSTEAGLRFCHDVCRKLAIEDRRTFTGPPSKWQPPRGKR